MHLSNEMLLKLRAMAELHDPEVTDAVVAEWSECDDSVAQARAHLARAVLEDLARGE
jgi:hypothetical protein